MSKKSKRMHDNSIPRFFTCVGCETEFTTTGCKLEVPECNVHPGACPFESMDVAWEEVTENEFNEFDNDN